jgi:hypothetical protein
MPPKKTITKREFFVDRLTVSEVAVFVGVHVTTIKERDMPYGNKNADGWLIYTIEDACHVFKHFNGREPTGSEVGYLMSIMGADEERARWMALKLYARDAIANKEIDDRDL